MTYTEHETAPSHVHHVPVEGTPVPTEIKWSGAMPVPAVGTVVKVRINRIGPATVVRYYVEHGWLGLIVKPHTPPEWYVKQNGRSATCHVVGVEIDLIPGLQCAMIAGCTRPITHVDDKGYVYCAPCAENRRSVGSNRRVRKLRPYELGKLGRGETIRY